MSHKNSPLYAKEQDIVYVIQCLKVLKDKQSLPEFQYTASKIIPALNRVILELEDMIN